MIAHLRSPTLRPVTELSNRLDLEYIERLWSSGGWSFTVPTDSREGLLLLTTKGLGLQLTEHERVIGGGPYRTDVHHTDIDSDTITVAGVDDFGTLATRFCYPGPASDPTSWNAATKDVITAASSSALRELFNRNAGPSATAARRIPNLTLPADPGEGSVITVTGNGQSLLDAFRQYGQSPAMVCRLRQTGHGEQTFTVRAARDRTEIVFSPANGTIESYQRQRRAPLATHVIVSDGADAFIELAAPASSWFTERIERFIDARGEASLTQTANNYLAENVESVSLQVVPLENPSTGRVARYGIDFDMGDLVSIELPEGRSIAQLTSATVTQTGDIDRRVFTVGPELLSPTDNLRNREARLETAVRRLERN